jgi:hypothetical protein
MLVSDCPILIEADYFNPAVTQELDGDFVPFADHLDFACDRVNTAGFFVIGVGD